MLNLRGLSLICITLCLSKGMAAADVWAHPTTQATTRPALRTWGLDSGVQIGLWPKPGPRGLIRIYTPYLHLDADRMSAADQMLNFIAIEPTVRGVRDLSEMQPSEIDHRQGKVIEAVDRLNDPPGSITNGVVESIDGVEQLSLFLRVEPFKNGAHVDLKAIFRADRPDEVAFQPGVRRG